MQDELENMAALLRDIVASPTPTEPAFITWQASLQTETERIKKAFVKEAFGLTKEKHIERYIQFHQTAIVELIDQVLLLIEPQHIQTIAEISPTQNRGNALKTMYRQLEELLVYIERHFAKYFNLSAKAPESYRFMVHRELTGRLPEVRYALEKKGTHKRLLSIALQPLDNFVQGIRAQEVSYKRIIYLRGLLAEALLLADSKLTGRRLDYKICLSMAYLNYNTPKFFNYCVREITTLVQHQPTLSKQIEKLAYLMKVVNQVRIKPGFMYNEKLDPLTTQLATWIEAEIYFLEKRQQLSINFPANADDPVQKEFRLQLSISVAQLACLLRALKDIGIIKNNNVLEVIRFVAGIVQTKNTEHISWESLRTKFYNTETSAREAVKNIALAIFNYTRKPIR